MRYAIIFIAMLVAGCATSYGGGVFGSSVEADWQSADKLMVTAQCNEFTSKETVAEFVSLRAAEEAINAGYRYMVVSRRVDVSQVDTHVVHSHSDESNHSSAYGVRGHDEVRSETSSYYANPENTFETTKPGLRVTYSLYKDRPASSASGEVLDAQAIYSELGPIHLKKNKSAE